jgi:hypothetical protein
MDGGEFFGWNGSKIFISMGNDRRSKAIVSIGCVHDPNPM